MTDELPEKDKQSTHWSIVLGLAMALPSSIIGVFFVLWYLMEQGHIDLWHLVLILVLVIVNTLFLMVRYVSLKQNKHK